MNVSDTLLHACPYPIAKSYERLLRTRGMSERHDQLRYLFETTLKYCASIAIADMVKDGEPDASAKGALACLARPSLGHWVGLLRHGLRSRDGVAGELGTLIQRRLELPRVIDAFQAAREVVEATRSGKIDRLSPLAFIEMFVAYRNKTIGHGAPSFRQVQTLVPLLEAALVELIEALQPLRDYPLAYVSEVHFSRSRFVHALTRLMGNSQVPMPDYVAGAEMVSAGMDRTLCLLEKGTHRPVLNLHPLMVYVGEDVYLLQHSDLKRSVEYLCYYTGDAYQADHIFEDFRQRFAGVLEMGEQPRNDPEPVLLDMLTLSLLDGVIQDAERAHIMEVALRLGVPEIRVHALETQVVDELASRGPQPAIAVTADDDAVEPPAGPAVLTLVDQQLQLLQDFGRRLLDHLRRQPDPTRPIKLVDLVRALRAEDANALAGMTPQMFARLITDAQNHGLTPGLVKTAAGYAVLEDHLASKISRDREFKDEIARFVVSLITDGMTIGLDGGSTTLPIAESIVDAIDSEMVSALTIVTNSLPVAQRFADFVERRGWSDAEAPIVVHVCAGQVRPVTKAIAEPSLDSTVTGRSLSELIEGLGGLDCCFIGANGITAAEGMTMPTAVELDIKRRFLSGARRPYIAADVSKCGLRFPVRIAGWDEDLTLVTNHPGSGSAELDRILAVIDRRVKVLFAEPRRDA